MRTAGDALPSLDRDLEAFRLGLHESVDALDAALRALDGSRDEVDVLLASVPALERRLVARAAQDDVAGPAVPVDGPAWQVARITAAGVTFRMMLDAAADDPVMHWLSAGLVPEESLIELMLQMVGPGDHVLDLGAHVGLFSLAASASGCLGIAVEASPALAALLRASVALNGFHGLHVIEAAATDAAGPVAFLARGSWGHLRWEAAEPGAAEPGASGPEAGTGFDTVAGVTVDELLSAFPSSTPAFVKMDVEGAEPKAIAGMHALLAGPDAPPVLYESNGHALALAGTTPEQLQASFLDLGFATYLVEGRRLTRLAPGELQIVTVANCLATKRRPAGLDGWQIRLQSTEEDVLLRVVNEAHHDNPDCRRYAAEALARLDPDLLSHPMVSRALAALRDDAVPDVAAAAAWSADLGPVWP